MCRSPDGLGDLALRRVRLFIHVTFELFIGEMRGFPGLLNPKYAPSGDRRNLPQRPFFRNRRRRLPDVRPREATRRASNGVPDRASSFCQSDVQSFSSLNPFGHPLLSIHNDERFSIRLFLFSASQFFFGQKPPQTRPSRLPQIDHLLTSRRPSRSAIRRSSHGSSFQMRANSSGGISSVSAISRIEAIRSKDNRRIRQSPLLSRRFKSRAVR